MNGYINFDILSGAGKKKRLWMERGFGPIQVFNKRNDAAFIVKNVALVGSFINDLYLDAGIQKGHFSNTL